MALFGSVSGGQVDDFAKSLVEELTQQFPPTNEQLDKKNSKKKVFSVLDGLFSKASSFKKQHQLGVYKRARLANTFRWELQEKGYDTTFVEFATESLVLILTRKD